MPPFVSRSCWAKCCVVLSMLCGSLLCAPASQAAPTAIDASLYFQANVRDADYCSLQLVNGQLLAMNKTTNKPISNPAMSCPDMFSWKLFAETIQDKFWSAWADEAQNWPAQPYPQCQGNQTPSTAACCDWRSANNDRTHCPVYPASAHAPLLKSFAGATEAAAQTMANQPELHRHTRLPFHANLNALATFSASTSNNAAAPIPICSAAQVQQISSKVKPARYESIGRILRQTNAELTIRNLPFHRYLFVNNLYNADGPLAAFLQQAASQRANAPYQLPANSTSRIDLPPDAIMIKSNWVAQTVMKAVGLPADPREYVSKKLQTQINLKNLGIAASTDSCYLQDTHFLVAFHISSKDIPNWVWTTFEHVNLPGRCDITGCNDAYGYASADKNRPAGTADNYVRPNQQSDQLNDASNVFAPDAGYRREQIRPELDAILKALNIGSREQTNTAEPTAADVGWRQFRLKGSQVDFVTSTGRPTLLGNSVTEAGFMDGSSCIGCHARAGVAAVYRDANGKPLAKPTASFSALSVFEQNITDFGYFRSHHGIPNPNWYFSDNNNSPELQVLQADFVWGFLNAQPTTTSR